MSAGPPAGSGTTILIVLVACDRASLLGSMAAMTDMAVNAATARNRRVGRGRLTSASHDRQSDRHRSRVVFEHPEILGITPRIGKLEIGALHRVDALARMDLRR